MKHSSKLAAFTLSLTLAASAQAEILTLTNDGELRGEVLNKDESPRKTYVVRTPSGGVVTLDRSQVKSVKRQSPAELEYDRIRGDYPDTVEGHLQLAEWCRTHSLTTLRQAEYMRILELDPENVEAHRGLGHTQMNGRWTSSQQTMKDAGYVFFKGKWRTPQEVEIMEAGLKAELAEKDWLAKMKRWRSWYGTDKQEQARQNILEITDPFAIKALSTYLTSETTRESKQLFIDALSHVGTAGAMDVLAKAGLNEPDDEVRLACLEAIVEKNYRGATDMFIQSLKDKENVTVNRAAVALSYMKDPVAISPLIDALITTHKFRIVKGQPGQTSATFGTGPSGPGGFSFGGGGVEERKQQIANHAVLETLVQLAGGVNFNFDTQAWKYWYAAQKKPSAISSRRD